MAQTKKPAAKAKPKNAKAAETKPTAKESEKKPRELKKAGYTSFKLSKRVKRDIAKMPGVFTILRESLALLWQHKWRFLGILTIFGLLQIILVQGILGSDFNEVVAAVKDALNTDKPSFDITIALFAYLIGTSGSASTSNGNVYQILLVLVASLALIWALRQLTAGTKIRIRDAYYKGMHPIIPFILVFLTVLLETIPLLIGVWLFNTVRVEGIAPSVFEQVFWFAVAGLFALLSIYLLIASVIALYVSALPDMTPFRALRSAHRLVKFRRIAVLWRILFLGIVYIVVLAAIVLPVISIAPTYAPWAFYLVTVLLLAVVHSYMYRLYRELLHDAE
jgi:hypothetical protein